MALLGRGLRRRCGSCILTISSRVHPYPARASPLAEPRFPSTLQPSAGCAAAGGPPLRGHHGARGQPNLGAALWPTHQPRHGAVGHGSPGAEGPTDPAPRLRRPHPQPAGLPPLRGSTPAGPRGRGPATGPGIDWPEPAMGGPRRPAASPQPPAGGSHRVTQPDHPA